VRVLLDENIPIDFAVELTGHEKDTVVGLGWAGIANGKLLARASRGYHAFVTMDRNIEYQQNVPALPFGVIVVRAPSHRLIHLRPLAPAILDALIGLSPGQLRHVGE